GLLHGVAGTQLLSLQNKTDITRRHTLFNQLGPVTRDHHDPIPAHLTRRFHHVLNQRFTADGMENLRQVGTHTGTFTGSEDKNIEHDLITPCESDVVYRRGATARGDAKRLEL